MLLRDIIGLKSRSVTFPLGSWNPWSLLLWESNKNTEVLFHITATLKLAPKCKKNCTITIAFLSKMSADLKKVIFILPQRALMTSMTSFQSKFSILKSISSSSTASGCPIPALLNSTSPSSRIQSRSHEF